MFPTCFIVTHAYIFFSSRSTVPRNTASVQLECSPTNRPKDDFEASAPDFMPGNLRRQTARPVSYYALF